VPLDTKGVAQLT